MFTVTRSSMPLDVEQVAAVFGDERIDDQHARAERRELVGEIAADESEPAGDHHPAVAIEGAKVPGAGAGGRAHASDSIRARRPLSFATTISSTHMTARSA